MMNTFGGRCFTKPVIVWVIIVWIYCETPVFTYIYLLIKHVVRCITCHLSPTNKTGAAIFPLLIKGEQNYVFVSRFVFCLISSHLSQSTFAEILYFIFIFVWYVEYWSILFSLCWSDVTVRVWADLVQNSSWEHISLAVQWFSFHKAHVPIAVTTLKPLTGGYTVSWEEYSCSDIKKQVKWKTIDHSLILQWETLTPSINMEVNLTHTTQGFPRLSSCSSLWRAGS